MVAGQHQGVAGMQALHKTGSLLELRGRRALRQVARDHGQRYPQPLRQPLHRGAHLGVVCAEMQVGQVHQHIHARFL